MLDLTASRIILYFAVYSILGWVCETVYCSIGQRKPVNRGFLNGPYCPVYGFGALLIIGLAMPFSATPPLVFAITLLACGVLEYFTGWLLETAFQTRWWDYSGKRFNLKGRVCLLNLLLFGAMGLALTYWVHPWAAGVLDRLPQGAQRIAALVVLAVMAADLIQTVATITHLRDRLHRLQAVLATLERYEAEHSWYDKRDTAGSLGRLRALCDADAQNESAREILSQIDRLTGESGRGRRLIRAFPDARFKGLDEAVSNLRLKWNEAREKLEKKGR